MRKTGAARERARPGPRGNAQDGGRVGTRKTGAARERAWRPGLRALTLALMTRSLRLAPIPGPDAVGARLAGGWLWFSQVRAQAPDGAAQVLPTAAVAALYPQAMAPLARLAAARAPLCGLALDRPRLVAALVAQAAPPLALAAARQGAAVIEIDEPAAASRAGAALQAEGCGALVAARDALADGLVRLRADQAGRIPRGAAAMLAHGRGGGAWARVDALTQALEAAMIAGAPRERLALDPGPVFGDDGAQALGALAPLHATGCAVVADLTGAPDAAALGAGVALALASGAQLLRVDAVAAAASAAAQWMAAHRAERR